MRSVISKSETIVNLFLLTVVNKNHYRLSVKNDRAYKCL